MANGSQRRFVIASATSTLWAFGALVLGALPAMLVAFPLGFGTYYGLRGWRRKRLVQQMGPALAASRGELPPPPPGEPAFPTADGGPTGAM